MSERDEIRRDAECSMRRADAEAARRRADEAREREHAEREQERARLDRQAVGRNREKMMSDAQRDRVEPGEKWEFDENVAAVFEDMLARSIPQYEVMRKAVTDLALQRIRHHHMSRPHVADLGASRGSALAPILEECPVAVYHALEISEPMCAVLRDRFADDSVRVYQADLREGLPSQLPNCDVILSVLTLQFTPIEYRQQILRRVWQRVKPGGALILVEKVLGGSADLDAAMVECYYDLKGSNGYSPEAIEKKRRSLEGVLVPVTAAWNEELLRTAGFTQVDSFWRWMNFAGWLAIK